MIPVWQNIKGQNGNCMQATVASLLELEINAVPNFKLAGKRALRDVIAFMKQHGYSFVRLINPKQDLTTIKDEEGINGYFFGIVRSKINIEGHHAVVVDRNCNIIHTVNKEYDGIKQFDKRSESEINGLIFIFVFNPTNSNDTDEILKSRRMARKHSLRAVLLNNEK